MQNTPLKNTRLKTNNLTGGKLETSLKKGFAIETLAVDFLIQQGLKPLSRNFRCKFGEIDLICRQLQTLVFIEVRFRKNLNFGGPLASVDYRKQEKLRRTAQFFLMSHPNYQSLSCRFDVIGATLKNDQTLDFDWIQNAF